MVQIYTYCMTLPAEALDQRKTAFSQFLIFHFLSSITCVFIASPSFDYKNIHHLKNMSTLYNMLYERTFSCSRARCYTCSFLNSATSISDLNPISSFGTILHAPPPTSFTAFLAVNVANFTSVKRTDVYLIDLLNTFVP